jgi:hypothetical protein
MRRIKVFYQTWESRDKGDFQLHPHRRIEAASFSLLCFRLLYSSDLQTTMTTDPTVTGRMTAECTRENKRSIDPTRNRCLANTSSSATLGNGHSSLSLLFLSKRVAVSIGLFHQVFFCSFRNDANPPGQK